MKNISLISAVLFFILVFAACSINVPWDIMDEYDGVRVVLLINPRRRRAAQRQADRGRLQFSSYGTALRLASRQNELVFKKEGFREEAVDLRTYSSRQITLKVVLQSEEPRAPRRRSPSR